MRSSHYMKTPKLWWEFRSNTLSSTPNQTFRGENFKWGIYSLSGPNNFCSVISDLISWYRMYLAPHFCAFDASISDRWSLLLSLWIALFVNSCFIVKIMSLSSTLLICRLYLSSIQCLKSHKVYAIGISNIYQTYHIRNIDKCWPYYW